jgi:hypothetical protein
MTKNSKRHMNAIARTLVECTFLCAAVMPVAALAEVRLTTKEWAKAPVCPGELRTIQEQTDMQQGIRPRPFVLMATDAECPATEVDRLEAAARRAAAARSAVPLRSLRDADLGLSHKLFIDKRTHYLQPTIFMAKQHPGEVCAPAQHDKTRAQQCVEGRRYRKDCHLLIFNDQFQEVGHHRIEIKGTDQFHCNAVPALGVGDKATNLILATIQYGPFDSERADSVSKVGQGWKRMTVALRLRQEADGHVVFQQEDDCLGNPNHIDSVPDAKRRSRECAKTSK